MEATVGDVEVELVKLMEYVGGTTLNMHKPRLKHPDKQNAKLMEKRQQFATETLSPIMHSWLGSRDRHGTWVAKFGQEGETSGEQRPREQQQASLSVASDSRLFVPAHKRRVLGGDATFGVCILTPGHEIAAARTCRRNCW